MEAVERPSPNFGDRRGGAVDLVVLHYTAMADAEAALTRLCDPEAEVSAHYLIAKDGTLYKLVEEDKRAWHAGQGCWAGHEDVNSRSIGIELDNPGGEPFADELMDTLEELLADILERHDLSPKTVIAHSDLAPGRKYDPGVYFDWHHLADVGLSIWPDPAQGGDFIRNAAYFGYPVEAGQGRVLDAFRLRFRPGASGPLSPADEALMAGLARQYPADVTERIARRVPSRPLRPLS